MLAGTKAECGIELVIADVVDEWVLGSFLIWVHGTPIGDRADHSVDIKGCINWMKDFVEHPRNRLEPGLFTLPKDEVYRLFSAMDETIPAVSPIGRQIEKAFSRFHISHLGMSSFNQVTLLLLEDEQGRQRLIWQQESDPVKEAFLPPGRMQQVASEFIERASGMLTAS